MVYDFGGTGVNRGRNSEDLSTFFETGKNRNLFSLMDYFHQGWPEIHLTDNGGIMDLSHRSFYAWTAMPPPGGTGRFTRRGREETWFSGKKRWNTLIRKEE
jgi:hypothetical protein